MKNKYLKKTVYYMSEKNKKEKPYYAHSVENQPESQWQTLSSHLAQVGEMAAGFVSCFDAQSALFAEKPLQLLMDSQI